MNKRRDQPGDGGGIREGIRAGMGWIGIAWLALGLTGCALLRHQNSPPKTGGDSLQLTNKPAGSAAFTELQEQSMRFADTYVATVAQACDDVTTNSTNSDLRLMALRWKLGQATSAYTDATGENPAVNTLDMVVLASLARMVSEDYLIQTYGDAVQPLVDAQRGMESNAWSMADAVLNPSQEQELKDLLQDWRQKNPHQNSVGQIRFQEFVTAIGRMPAKTKIKPTSIFSLLYLDPLAGLDPTVAAIKETRELGERAMYYTQRMPTLINWQAQLLAYQLTEQPASRQVLSDANQLAESAGIFARTAQQLPQLINDQRQAAIQQILDGLTTAGDKSRGLLTDTRSTLDSASGAASNINTAIKSLDSFVRFVTPTNSSAEPTSTNDRPFNVLDYGVAASQIGIAASNLETLLASVNQSAPQIGQLGQQAAADADRVTQHIFWLVLLLILIFLAGSVAAGLLYRVMANKLDKGGRESAGPKS